MNRIQILAYLFILLSVLKLGMVYYLEQITTKSEELSLTFKGIKWKVNDAKTFKDSLIYNVRFRQKVLDTLSSEKNINDVINEKRENAKEAIKSLENLRSEREEIKTELQKYETLDVLLNFFFAINGILLFYYYFKPG